MSSTNSFEISSAQKIKSTNSKVSSVMNVLYLFSDIDAVGDVTSKIKVSDVTDKSGYRHYPDISNEITDSMKREYKLR